MNTRFLAGVIVSSLVCLTVPGVSAQVSVGDTYTGVDFSYQDLIDAGIISGLDGDLMLADEITRAEMAKIIVTGANHEVNVCEGAPHFTDVSPEHSLYEYVETAYCNGFIGGRGEGLFGPDTPVLKQEAVKMIMSAFRSADMKQGTSYFTPDIYPVGSQLPVNMDDVTSFGFDMTLSSNSSYPSGESMAMTLHTDGHLGEGTDMEVLLDSVVSAEMSLSMDEDSVYGNVQANFRMVDDDMYMYIKQLDVNGTIDEPDFDEILEQIEELAHMITRRWIYMDVGYDSSLYTGGETLFEQKDAMLSTPDPFYELFGHPSEYSVELIDEAERVNGISVSHYSVVSTAPEGFKVFQRYEYDMGSEYFDDVSTTSEFYDDIHDAVELGIAYGEHSYYPYGYYFYPEEILWRGEAFSMLQKARNLLQTGVSYEDQISSISTGTSRADIYIGNEFGRLYRMDIVHNENEPIMNGTTTHVLTVELSDFNEPFEVDEPKEYVTIDELVEELEDMFGAF